MHFNDKGDASLILRHKTFSGVNVLQHAFIIRVHAFILLKSINSKHLVHKKSSFKFKYQICIDCYVRYPMALMLNSMSA